MRNHQPKEAFLAAKAAIQEGPMQAVIDRVAMIERVDNGLIVRFREPVETKRALPMPPKFLSGMDPRGQTGESWKQGEGSDEEDGVVVWIFELRAVYCKDEEAAIPYLRAARAGVEKIRDLRRDGAFVVEAEDDGPGGYTPCR